ncbi:hypothetical protein BDV33DRAFT_197118 [Aspergillus novoparasiticus]|uniref:Uncharacterized protein n=1 Tax=Aspergillus novoparasiticus TaxID=986946 RepID=A0A5N6E9I2_9EURO|nr:hypothetical protein BDV33DRAFT_197118 [Aspergillus novoparasiticus]
MPPGLTAEEAVAKLVKFANAFQLLTNGEPPANAKGAKQKMMYLEVLRNVRRKCGDTGVILCAAGLGISAITNMRNDERVFLPYRLAEKWDELEIDVFSRLAHRNAPLASVHGDVYELSMEDVKKIAAMPGQITGKIRLIDPYNRYQSSFVTIPLSKELTDSLIIDRERIVE